LLVGVTANAEGCAVTVQVYSVSAEIHPLLELLGQLVLIFIRLSLPVAANDGAVVLHEPYPPEPVVEDAYSTKHVPIPPVPAVAPVTVSVLPAHTLVVLGTLVAVATAGEGCTVIVAY
jgi:hypothetical protein